MLKILENLFFYTKCNWCGNTNTIYLNQNLFCKDCINCIKKENLIYCKSCGNKTSNCLECKISPKYNEIKIFTTYDGILREIILNYKFKFYKNISKVLANLIEDDLTKFINEKEIDVILPVPSSKNVEKQRGFNHLEEILKNIPRCKILLTKNLLKIKNTPLQIEVSGNQRRENLKGSFYIKNYKDLENKNILVFDDILTTGATLMEIFFTLEKINTKGLYAYVIAT